MKLPKGATVAVADGAKLNLFRNTGDEASPKLTAEPHEAVSSEHSGAGGRHPSSSANPDDQQTSEDGFAGNTAALLNKQVLDGKISHLVVIAAPKTLGELRKHYHAKLSDVLVGELSKDLTGQSAAEVEKAIAAG